MQPFKVTQGHSLLCQSTRYRGLCDFLLAVNSNLTSVFNRSWSITPSSHIHNHLSSRWNWKKTAGSRWICFGVRVPRTLDYPIINWNPRKRAPYNHNARPSLQTDRETDRRTNVMAMARWLVLTNASRTKKFIDA